MHAVLWLAVALWAAGCLVAGIIKSPIAAYLLVGVGLGAGIQKAVTGAPTPETVGFIAAVFIIFIIAGIIGLFIGALWRGLPPNTLTPAE